MVVVMVNCLSPSSPRMVVARDPMPESMVYMVFCHWATFSTPLSGSLTGRGRGRGERGEAGVTVRLQSDTFYGADVWSQFGLQGLKLCL